MDCLELVMHQSQAYHRWQFGGGMEEPLKGMKGTLEFRSRRWWNEPGLMNRGTLRADPYLGFTELSRGPVLAADPVHQLAMDLTN